MYQVIQSAKVAQCNKTGNLGIIINGNVYPMGGGVSPEEVTAIVKEQFPGGVGYSEVSKTVLLPETDLQFVEGYDNTEATVMLDNPAIPAIGSTCTVVVDGTAYHGLVEEGKSYQQFKAKVEFSAMGKQWKVYFHTDKYVVDCSARASSNRIIEIYVEDAKITTLDEKYLPDSVKGGGSGSGKYVAIVELDASLVSATGGTLVSGDYAGIRDAIINNNLEIHVKKGNSEYLPTEITIANTSAAAISMHFSVFAGTFQHKMVQILQDNSVKILD